MKYFFLSIDLVVFILTTVSILIVAYLPISAVDTAEYAMVAVLFQDRMINEIKKDLLL